MDKHETAFIKHGFDTIDFVGEDIINDADLATMGINDPQDKHDLMEALKKKGYSQGKGPSINDVGNISDFEHPPSPGRQFFRTIRQLFGPIFDPFPLQITDVVYGRPLTITIVVYGFSMGFDVETFSYVSRPRLFLFNSQYF